MVRGELICDDKNMAKVLHAVTGLVHDIKWTSMANAKIGRNGQVVAKTPGDVASLFVDWNSKRKLHHINAADIKEFCREVGRQPSGYSSVIAALRKAGLLKKNGTKGAKTGYTVHAGR